MKDKYYNQLPDGAQYWSDVKDYYDRLNYRRMFPTKRSVKKRNKERRPPCPVECTCICHDTGGGNHDHHGKPCPGKNMGS